MRVQKPQRTSSPVFGAAGVVLLFGFILTLTFLAGRLSAFPATQRQLESASFKLAKEESLGFFDDISDREWRMLKEKTISIYPNAKGNPRDGWMVPDKWFQAHYEPDFTCRHERRIGNLGDGGKWICDPHRISQQEKCLVYSVGSNGDASFESAVQREIGKHCEIHVFDFGNYAKTVQEQAPGVHYHQWGFSKDTAGKFKTLQETVTQLGHRGRTIDIFKIDCDGCELTTFSSWFDADVDLRQILVEIHADFGQPGAVRNPETSDLFDRLYQEGYVITHKEANLEGWIIWKAVEYVFLKLSPDFLGAV